MKLDAQYNKREAVAAKERDEELANAEARFMSIGSTFNTLLAHNEQLRGVKKRFKGALIMQDALPHCLLPCLV